MNEHFAQTDGESTDLKTTLQLVGFVIGDELFGVDILTVQEIIRDATITAIPDAPDFLEGVINLRGSIIPVIDLRKRLKLVQSAPRILTAGLLSLRRGPHYRFCRGSGHQGAECPVRKHQTAARYRGCRIEKSVHPGVCKLDQRLLILLDFSRILMVDEIKKLKSMKRPKAPVRL
jgi:purine-binding chemotaxis protein CheW